MGTWYRKDGDPNGHEVGDSSRENLPLALEGCEEERIFVQNNLLYYLVLKASALAPEQNPENSANQIMAYGAYLLEEQYDIWFKNKVKEGIVVGQFLRDYGIADGEAGPGRVFAEIFPGQTVDQFLYACLNGNDRFIPEATGRFPVVRDPGAITVEVRHDAHLDEASGI